MLADDVHPDRAAQERLEEIRVGSRRLDAGQPAVGEVAQARTEAEAEHGAEYEEIVRGTAGVHEMGVDPQASAVVEQAVEHVGGLVGRCRDNPDMVGIVLVRDVGVNRLRISSPHRRPIPCHA